MAPGKKSSKVGLGRCIIKQMSDKRRKMADDHEVHRTKTKSFNSVLDSVTEQTDLTDFMSRLAISKMGDEETQSQTVRLLSSTASHGIISVDEKQKLARLHRRHKNELRIPRKPHWERTFTKEELHEAENIAFTDWRIDLSKIEKLDGIKLTPYEKNVEVWKQLWRVVERSDVIVQIVDARNPMMFRCSDLEAYVKELDENKLNLLLVNKSDYLTESQRDSWAQYFRAKNIYAVFFSALAETDDASHFNEVLSTVDENEIEENNELDNSNLSDNFETNPDHNLSEGTNDIEENSNHSTDVDNEENSNHSTDVDNEPSSMTTNSNNYETANEELFSVDNDDEDEVSFITDCSEDLNKDDENTDDAFNDIEEEVAENNQLNLVTINKVYNRVELIDLLAGLRPKKDGESTIGLVGYPNVGKSSTINCLMQDKKVTVSATPGKTKHFQTLYLLPDLVLCDCPGLVFPGFVTSRQEMIMWGILPIDRMKRENESSVTLLCSIIPPPALEATYSMALPGGQNRPPTPEEFLSAHALTRSFMSAAGRPDVSRSARDVLKDFMHGRLLHCVAPPGVEQDCYHIHDVAKNKKIVKLTAQQSVFMPETPEYIEAYNNKLSFGVPFEKHVEMKGKRARKQRIKLPKGHVEAKQGADGVEYTITKPWKNGPKQKRQGKKNPNTNVPYDAEYW